MQKTFAFDATNMLKEVVDSNLGTLQNEYNGLGFRVASNKPDENIEYLCDLSRDYYNLLERTINGETESFIYDNNVVSMSKAGRNYYYLQDELGSPMYLTGTDGTAVSSYAFDDFGRNIDTLTGQPKTNNAKQGYAKQGNIIQPFAFTGYQEDEISGLKFAQARFYDAKTGRFQSEDNVKGFISSPFSLNHYGYCFGNPVGITDDDGNWPKWIENVADGISDFWRNKAYGIERTTTYSNEVELGEVNGISASQSANHVHVVEDDGFRFIKKTTDYNATTEETTVRYSVNVQLLLGEKKDTGLNSSIYVQYAAKDASFSLGNFSKILVKGYFTDNSSKATFGGEKKFALKNQSNVGHGKHAIGGGINLEGIIPQDVLEIYGNYKYSYNGDNVTAKIGKKLKLEYVHAMNAIFNGFETPEMEGIPGLETYPAYNYNCGN